MAPVHSVDDPLRQTSRGGRLNWAQFAADSPLEQRRFELMVPPRTPAFRGRHMGPATARGFGVAPS
jgi:hypothetical protein